MSEVGELGFDLSPEQRARLRLLEDRLVAEGSMRGVTALKEREQIRAELIEDSLFGVGWLPTAGEVIDIGTGGGIPGLVLAIARPDLHFVLTDSAARKTRWVSECVEELALGNVTVVTERLEILGRQSAFRERFQAVTAKALASLAVLVEFASPLLVSDGVLLAYKGPAYTEELEQAEFALRELKLRLDEVKTHQRTDRSRYLLRFIKSEPISEEYPRRNGLPQKKPLSLSRKD